MEFRKLITDLVDAGLSEADIATHLSATTPTINRIKNGKQVPKYPLGKRLVDLHAEMCPGQSGETKEAA